MALNKATKAPRATTPAAGWTLMNLNGYNGRRNDGEKQLGRSVVCHLPEKMWLAKCWVDGGGLPGSHRGVGWGGDGLGWGEVIPTQRLATLLILRLRVYMNWVGMGWGGVG